MSERSQVQQNPFTSFAEQNLARLEAFYGQLAEMEQKAIEQQRSAMDEGARLSRETLAYGSVLAAEWRKSSLEAMRRATQMMANPFSAFGA